MARGGAGGGDATVKARARAAKEGGNEGIADCQGQGGGRDAVVPGTVVGTSPTAVGGPQLTANGAPSVCDPPPPVDRDALVKLPSRRLSYKRHTTNVR